MAFTRKFLKALNLTEETIDSIMDAHTEVTSALIAERDGYKTKVENYDSVVAERDSAKEQLAKARTEGAAEVQAKFDKYVAEVKAERENAGKLAQVKTALKNAGVQREEFIELLIGKVDLNNVTLTDGKLTDTAFVDSLKASYAGCFGSSAPAGAEPNNPPSNGNQQMTKEAFFKLSLNQQMAYANEHPTEWAEFNK